MQFHENFPHRAFQKISSRRNITSIKMLEINFLHLNTGTFSARLLCNVIFHPASFRRNVSVNIFSTEENQIYGLAWVFVGSGEKSWDWIYSVIEEMLEEILDFMANRMQAEDEDSLEHRKFLIPWRFLHRVMLTLAMIDAAALQCRHWTKKFHYRESKLRTTTRAFH